MCYQHCILPIIKNGYCPIHFIAFAQNKGIKLNRDCLREWVADNRRWAESLTCTKDDPELDCLLNSEVDLRNQALTTIYGRLPSYAYFSSESDFAENDWVDWWQAVLKDVKPINFTTVITN